MGNSIIVMENDMKANLRINKCKNENLEFFISKYFLWK
jgi:hypothetical protein